MSVLISMLTTGQPAMTGAKPGRGGGMVYLSPKGYVVSCRFHARLLATLFVCNFVSRSEITLKGGV